MAQVLVFFYFIFFIISWNFAKGRKYGMIFRTGPYFIIHAVVVLFYSSKTNMFSRAFILKQLSYSMHNEVGTCAENLAESIM